MTSKRAECIANNSRTENGLLIEGHPYRSVCAIYDQDNDRTYTVLECDNCGKVDAGFQNGRLVGLMARAYGPIVTVGGEA